jgi:putative spermidine/putrescine transport system permease protein
MKEKRSIYKIITIYTLVFLFAFPIFLLFIWAFSGRWSWPDLMPEALSLTGWRYFIDPANGALESLATSVIIGIAVTFITLLISIPAGKAMGLYKFPGKDIIKILILAPIIVPPLAVTMGIHINFMRLGLADKLIGVILVHLIPTLPYSIRIMTHTFEGISDKFEDQARVLGAGPFQRFWHITLPLISPGLFSAGILVFIISFSQYLLTFLIGGGRIITFTMVLFPLVNSGDRMLASVYSLVFIAAALVFTLLMERVLVNTEQRKDHFYI